MAKVLFLAPADLGEAVLATGALAHVLSGDDEVTVLCDPEASTLFRGVPGLQNTVVIRREAPFRSWAEALIQILEGGGDEGWAHTVDARENLWSKTVGLGTRRDRSATVLRHQVDDWTAAFQADRPLAPVMWLDAAARDAAQRVASDATQILVIAPGGVSEAKRWPAERYAAVARRLVDGPMTGALVLIISAAARDGDVARQIVASLAADGVAARDAGAALDLLGAAALMERATLVLGNDNALAHIAAAMGAPTLTLFGPTDERVRAPYGLRARTLRGRSLEALSAAGALDARAAMEDVSIDAVESAAIDLLHAGGLR